MKIFWIKTTKTSTVVLLMIFFSMLLPYTVTAQGTGFTPPPGGNPAAVVLQFYNLAFLIAGGLALLVLLYGAIRYGASGGISSAKSEGKSYMAGALGGLVLLFLAFLVLYTINPGLTRLSFPTLESLNVTEGGSPALPPGEAGSCFAGECQAISSFPCKNGCTADQSAVEMLGCMANHPSMPSGWRVTEAMPPTSPHKSRCHNDGTCIDMGRIDKNYADNCPSVNAVISIARSCGGRVLNEVPQCGGNPSVLSTNSHLHIIAP